MERPRWRLPLTDALLRSLSDDSTDFLPVGSTYEISWRTPSQLVLTAQRQFSNVLIMVVEELHELLDIGGQFTSVLLRGCHLKSPKLGALVGRVMQRSVPPGRPANGREVFIILLILAVLPGAPLFE